MKNLAANRLWEDTSEWSKKAVCSYTLTLLENRLTLLKQPRRARRKPFYGKAAVFTYFTDIGITACRSAVYRIPCRKLALSTMAKTAFSDAKEHLLQPQKPPFAWQNAAFQCAKSGVLMCEWPSCGNQYWHSHNTSNEIMHR